MRSILLLIAGAVSGFLMASQRPDTANPVYHFPLIKNAGGVVALPDAAEQPEPGAKLVLDVTGENEAELVTKGIDRAAVIMNLHAQVGHRPEQMKVTVILHGPATRAALHEAAYAERTDGDKNPNLAVMRELRQAGAEIFVCGQALAHQKIATEEVASTVKIAVSASTVLTSRQMSGFAYIPFP